MMGSYNLITKSPRSPLSASCAPFRSRTCAASLHASRDWRSAHVPLDVRNFPSMSGTEFARGITGLSMPWTMSHELSKS